ncbi:tetratricopeptide repeat protein [Anaerolineales bacterium HSG6]|nr:tetratricopeptide repeat protein [Anaerolineales bacterium HSG6]MDM8532284.1 tetratricopeptide repeat protein [Anaerolineales bacterium HSG25]
MPKQSSKTTTADHYTSIRATPELVGRENILDQISTAILDQGRAYNIYIRGGGGIGKSRLVRHILQNPPDQENNLNLLVANELVDLYHPSTYTVEGLIQEIQRVLAPEGKGFAVYQQEREKLDELKVNPPDKAETLRQQHAAMEAAFINNLNTLAQEKRIVLVLDTIEKLFYQEDPAAKALGVEEERPAIFQWLIDKFLPQLKNIVVLLSGRPGPDSFTQALATIAQQTYKLIELPGLNETETLTYFEAVQERAEQSEDKRTAQAIAGIPKQFRQVVFESLSDDSEAEGHKTVRPILLALAIDHLVVSGELLPAFRNKSKTLSAPQRKQIQHQLGSALIASLRQAERPADEIIITLGWLRRGAEAELLAQVMQYEVAEIEKHLERIKDLSFIKLRPSDKRYFLHDEVYDLLQAQGSETERQRVLKAVQGYYETRIEQLRQEVDALYQPLAETLAIALPDPGKILETRAKLQEATVEELHYRLRRSAVKGFEHYYRYSEEAVAGFDEQLGIQLRTELLGFLAERDPSGQAEMIDGLSRGVVVADGAVRLIEWKIKANRHAEARRIVRQLQEENRDIMENGDELVRAEFLSWQGYLAMSRREYEQAEILLKQAIQKLAEQLREIRRWRWGGIIARCYETLGFTYRLQGRMHQAINFYQKALPLWRKTKSEVQLAENLNNLSFVLAEIGSLDEARENVRQSLRLRERLGPYIPVGYSLTSSAAINVRQNNLDGAIRNAELALNLFTTLDRPVGQGLALMMLIEAKRRIGWLTTYFQQNKTAEFLSQATQHGHEAEQIFRSPSTPRPRILVELLLEQGRGYRDWARLRRDAPTMLALSEQEGTVYSVAELASRSRQVLQEAATLAEEGNLLFRQIDALIDLGWLGYYTELYVRATDFETVQEQIEQEFLRPAEQLIPPEYKTSPINDITRDVFLIWLGDLALLRGQIGFNHWLTLREKAVFSQAVEQLTLSLAYLNRYSDKTFVKKREAHEQIYEKLNQLEMSELQQVADLAREIETTFNLKPALTQFLENRFGVRTTEEDLLLDWD